MTQFFELSSMFSNPTALLPNNEHQKVKFIIILKNYKYYIIIKKLTVIARVRESKRVRKRMERMHSITCIRSNNVILN